MNEDRAYFILELKKGANPAQIKTAYKRLIKQYHPDNFYNDPQKRKFAEEKTREIIEAYKYLINKQNNYESSKSDSSEHNSSKDKNEDKTYDYSKANSGSYKSTYESSKSDSSEHSLLGVVLILLGVVLILLGVVLILLGVVLVLLGVVLVLFSVVIILLGVVLVYSKDKTYDYSNAGSYKSTYESSESDSSEHNSSKDKNEDKTYDHSKSNSGSYNSTNDNTYSQQTATRYGYSLYNGKSIFSFISGILSVFFTIISYLVFQIPITESVATQIIAIIVFFIISPIIVISYFIGRKHGNDHRKAAVYTFILSFFLFGLVPVLKLIVVSIILLPFPVLSIIYGIRGLVNFKYTNSGLWTGVIGLNMGTLSFIFFILHFAVGLTL